MPFYDDYYSVLALLPFTNSLDSNCWAQKSTYIRQNKIASCKSLATLFRSYYSTCETLINFPPPDPILRRILILFLHIHAMEAIYITMLSFLTYEHQERLPEPVIQPIPTFGVVHDVHFRQYLLNVLRILWAIKVLHSSFYKHSILAHKLEPVVIFDQ